MVISAANAGPAVRVAHTQTRPCLASTAQDGSVDETTCQTDLVTVKAPPQQSAPFRPDLSTWLRELEVLVNTDSGSGDAAGCDRMAEFFRGRFLAAGWRTSLERVSQQGGPALLAQNHDGDHHDILLIGPMDTVFSKGEAARRPFEVRDGRAYGPGVSDMKSGLLSALWVLESLSPADFPEGRMPAIGVVFNADEEIGSPWSGPLVAREAERSDVALVLEPARADGSLVTQRRGGATWKLAVDGKAAHSGVNFDDGVSAISELGHWICAVDGLMDREHNTTLHTGLVSGGVAKNTVAPHAEATIEMRFAETGEFARVRESLEHMAGHPFLDTDVTLKLSGYRPAMPRNEGTRRLADLVRDIAADLDIADVDFTATGGGSDASNACQAGAATIDGLGPVGGGYHTEGEYLEVGSVVPRMQLLRELIIRQAAPAKG